MSKRIPLHVILTSLLVSCGTSEVQKTIYKGSTLDVFHSFCSYSFDSDIGDYSKELQDFCIHFNNLSDPYNAYKGMNNLYTINQTHEPVKVEESLFAMLKKANELYEQTEHYFNPMIGKISSLWKATLFDADPEVSIEEIDLAKAQIPALLEEMNSSRIELDEDNLTVTRIGEAYVDLGGLVKGFATEMMEQKMIENGAERFLINAGTSSMCLGLSEKGEPFRVTMAYQVPNEEPVRYRLSNIDISTSAVYEQYVNINGDIYSHIINPLTGMPFAPYSMAFLAGQDSALLDAFSTACMLAGPEKSAEWAAKYQFDYALFKYRLGYAKFYTESEGLSKVRTE